MIEDFDKNTSEELSRLREDMQPAVQTLKDNLDYSKVLKDGDLRKAIRKESNWLNKLVKIEFLSMPFILLVLFAGAACLKMNYLCIVVVIIPMILDAWGDRKTLAISAEMIQNDSLVDMTRKLEHQKVIRRRQTLMTAPLAILWLGWFLYEYLKSPVNDISEDSLFLTWLIVFVIIAVISIWIIFIIYRKAQRTNDELIDQIRSFIEDSEPHP